MPASEARKARSHPPVNRAPLKAPRPKGGPPQAHGTAPTANALVHELSTCATEADLVQVLYRGLAPRFGYDVINLHVLELGGWYHSLASDSGVLQDLRRRPLSE